MNKHTCYQKYNKTVLCITLNQHNRYKEFVDVCNASPENSN